MTLQTSREPKNRQLLTVLAAITLAFFFIFSISNFAFPYGRKLRFHFPGILTTLITLLNIALRGGLVLYFVSLFKHEKAKQILTGIFAGFAVINAFTLLNYLVNMIRYNFRSFNFLTVLIVILNIALFALAALFVIQDGKNKVMVVLPAVLSLVISALGFLGNVISFIQYLARNMFFYGLINLSSSITALALALFLLVFASSYGATAVAPGAATQAPKALTGPERLQLLFQEYQKGNLTEEEFQAKRQEIIENF